MAFFADLGRFPEAVILPSRPVGGVWLRDYLLCFATCTWPTTLPSFSTATACRSKEFSSSTALQSTRIRGRGGGGLTARRKRKSSLLRPPPLFFLKVGRKRGGRNSGAVRYVYMCTCTIILWSCYDYRMGTCIWFLPYLVDVVIVHMYTFLYSLQRAEGQPTCGSAE